MYLHNVVHYRYRKALSQLRLSSHNLAIETGRHSNTPRELRFCILCKQKAIENEYHFVMICPFYKDLRERFFPQDFIVNISLFHFNKLLAKTDDAVLMANLGKFIYYAFKRRNDVIKQM